METFSAPRLVVPRPIFRLSIAIDVAHFVIQAVECGFEGTERATTTSTRRGAIGFLAATVGLAAARFAEVRLTCFRSKENSQTLPLFSLLSIADEIHSPEPARDSSANSARETRMLVGHGGKRSPLCSTRVVFSLSLSLFSMARDGSEQSSVFFFSRRARRRQHLPPTLSSSFLFPRSLARSLSYPLFRYLPPSSPHSNDKAPAEISLEPWKSNSCLLLSTEGRKRGKKRFFSVFAVRKILHSSTISPVFRPSPSSSLSLVFALPRGGAFFLFALQGTYALQPSLDRGA